MNTGTLREPKGTDGQLGDIEESDIISDGSHYHAYLITFRSFHSTSDSSQGDWRFVDLAHKQSFQDDFVELGIRSSSKETIQLHEDAQVGILGDGSISVLLLIFVVLDIDTHVALVSSLANGC